MPELEDFQSRSFRFACDVVRFYMKLARMPAVPAQVARQILDAGTSVGANLEEAKGAQTRRDTTNKFSVALKEARETRYWLRLITATDLVPEPLARGLLKESNELVAISHSRAEEPEPGNG